MANSLYAVAKEASLIVKLHDCTTSSSLPYKVGTRGTIYYGPQFSQKEKIEAQRVKNLLKA